MNRKPKDGGAGMTRLTPLAIVRRTPMSNCGRCGQPTCLAFGAAVVATGLDLALCPFLDRAGLPATPVAAARDQESRELEFIAALREKSAGLDLVRLAPRLGAELVPGEPAALRFRYLGQEALVLKSGLLLDGREPEDHRDQILLYNYLASRADSPPSGDWVGLESLPNSISKVKTLATYCEERLAALFSGADPARLAAAWQAVDGVAVARSGASRAAEVAVLPMIPQLVIFWEAAPEEGFAAQVKVLFDRQVLAFLDLESLVFSAERLADRLLALVNGDPR